MIILGSGGFAMQILDVLVEDTNLDVTSLSFFNDTGHISNAYIHEHFTIVTEKTNLTSQSTTEFVLGTGTPSNREKMYQLFSEMPNFQSKKLVSKHAIVSKINVRIGEACTVMPGAIIMGNVDIGKGSLINCHTSIGHDSKLGEFVEICPGVMMAGNCTIGKGTFIGSGAVIFPGITIGENCIIGAGSVITKDVPDHQKVIGNPGRATHL